MSLHLRSGPLVSAATANMGSNGFADCQQNLLDRLECGIFANESNGSDGSDYGSVEQRCGTLVWNSCR